MRKLIAFFLIIAFTGTTFLHDVSALSNGVAGPENYPGKMDIKNVNGLGKNIGTDFFGGAMTFRYPMSFPAGSRGLTPGLELSYSSNNGDAFSPYGYGFSLSLSRIQRSAKKGVSELYVGDEFSAFGNDLINISSGATLSYRSKDASDQNLYTRSGSAWIVQTSEGKTLVYGSVATSRIADPLDASKIYAWLLNEERDIFGHAIKYSYFLDGGQPYVSDIFYGFDANSQNPLYTIHFDYSTKGASLTSYRTQFEISTRKLLSSVSLLVNGAKIRGYEFAYDDPDSPISHLVRITEIAGAEKLPSMNFAYGDGQYRHMITIVDNNRGGIARFEYTPSTAYRNGSGELMNAVLPFVVNTLSHQILDDRVTGISSEESYEYAGGHYYFDSADLWGREYVGFRTVTVSDDTLRTAMYFHQSQTAEKDPLKYDDHIAKKGKIYRSDTFDKNTGKILSTELTRYDMRLISPERRLVFPSQKIGASFDTDGTHADTAVTYVVDDVGNTLEENRFGFVTANIRDGTYQDIPGDNSRTVKTFTANPSKNLYRFPLTSKIYGYSGELLSDNRIEYDGTASGVIFGLVTRKVQKNTINSTEIIDTMTYSIRGLLISQIDAVGNTTNSAYDGRDIALVSTTNPLGWMTHYTYDYALGRPTTIENYNGVKTTTRYDTWGRESRVSINSEGSDIVLSQTSYNDSLIPNSITQTSYFDATLQDKKTTRNYTDGWGRTISSLTSTEKAGQFSSTQIRYDDDGNPIYAGYPVFVANDAFDTSLVLTGVVDGEVYRARSPGMSYRYDAIGRIISQRDAQGITSKMYLPKSEKVTNTLGFTTIGESDAYGNLTRFVEKLPNRDITTTYRYDAIGHPIQLTDTLGNIRTWSYDGFGRLVSATDIHTPSDTSYGVRSYHYDALGRVDDYTNPKGEKVQYAYDNLSRIIQEQIGSDTTRTYVYDLGTRARGTLTSVTDSGSTVTYGYDPLGRKILENRTIDTMTYSLDYTYNIANILTSITYPDTGKTQYRYKNGYIEGVSYTNPLGTETTLISDISYAPNATMKSIRYGNGVVKNTERDANYNYRLTRSTAVSADNTKLLDTEYRYDAVNNIDRIVESGIDPLRKAIDYTYDPLARLSGANYSYAVAGYGRDQSRNLSYSYDDIGNITNASNIGAYLYSGAGYANPHAVTSAGGTSYDYDAAGQTLSRQDASHTLGFTYSPYGEQLSSTANGEVTNYLYDQTRRRIVKSTLGLREHHVIDGYEVEYESGALIPVVPPASNLTSPPTNTGTIAGTSGTGVYQTGSLTSSGGITSTGSVVLGSGATSTGTLTASGTSSSGTTSTGISIVSGSGVVTQSGGVQTATGTSTSTGVIVTSSGVTSTGTITSTGTLSNSGTTSSGSTESGTTVNTGMVVVSSSGSTESGTYIVVAGYTATSLSGALPVTLTTTTTHIMLGDERIATFQSQSDDTPRTPDDDKLIYHISDHLNSSSLDLSSTGVVLQAVDYLPFGEKNVYEVTSKRIKGTKGGYTNKYLFANKQLDTETDLQYFEKRYYDNRIGRFTTEDPVFWEVGLTKRPGQYFTDPQQWNTYSYVRNNPLNLVDPTGEVLDTLVDAGFSVADASILLYYEARAAYNQFMAMQNLGNYEVYLQYQNKANEYEKKAGQKLADLGMDAISMAIPFFSTGILKAARVAARSADRAKDIGFKALQRHFNKHGAEFGFKTKDSYLKAAQDLAGKEADGKKILEKINKEGDSILKYDTENNAFTSINIETGEIRTFFKPKEGADYFTNQ